MKPHYPLISRDGGDVRFFDFTKLVKNRRNDPRWPFDPSYGLTWTARKNWTKHSFIFLKFIFVEIERKTISRVVMLTISYSLYATIIRIFDSNQINFMIFILWKDIPMEVWDVTDRQTITKTQILVIVNMLAWVDGERISFNHCFKYKLFEGSSQRNPFHFWNRSRRQADPKWPEMTRKLNDVIFYLSKFWVRPPLWTTL